MKNVFSFCNQKGGVGKTTSVINIAATLAQEGKKTLIIDMDSQANATSGIGEEKPSDLQFTAYQLFVDNFDPNTIIRKTSIENLHLIPSSPELSGVELDLVNSEEREFQLKKAVDRFRDEFDYVLIDCPPSLGLLTINTLTAADQLIIPLQCEYYALEGLGQLINTFSLVQKNLSPGLEVGGVILTMADFRTNLTQQVIEEVRNFFKDKVFNTIVPRSVKLSEAPSFGKPAVIYDPHGRGSQSYKQLAQEFLSRFPSSAKKNNQIKIEAPSSENSEQTETVQN